MSRCIACNTRFNRNPGWKTLPDGTKVEEDMCPDCRGQAFAPDEYEHEFMLSHLTELGYIHYIGGLTPVKFNKDYD